LSDLHNHFSSSAPELNEITLQHYPIRDLPTLIKQLSTIAKRLEEVDITLDADTSHLLATELRDLQVGLVELAQQSVRGKLDFELGKIPVTLPHWRFIREQRALFGNDGERLDLTQQESKLLMMLLAVQGKVVDRVLICRLLEFGTIEEGESRLNTLICRLRRKLKQFSPQMSLQTWRNEGYAYIGPTIEVRRSPMGDLN
jgi:DNA-binding winged helix-turn-helix (wHTH) protein